MSKEILESVAPLMIKRGNAWVELDEVISETNIERSRLEEHFPNKALLCQAYLSDVDERSDRKHEEILTAEDSVLNKVEAYFDELLTYMKDHMYAGCPFANTASAMGGEEDPEVMKLVRDHKTKLASFFEHLVEPLGEAAHELLGHSIYLLYSGATTESKSLRSVKPIEKAKVSAMYLCSI